MPNNIDGRIEVVLIGKTAYFRKTFFVSLVTVCDTFEGYFLSTVWVFGILLVLSMCLNIFFCASRCQSGNHVLFKEDFPPPVFLMYLMFFSFCNRKYHMPIKEKTVCICCIDSVTEGSIGAFFQNLSQNLKNTHFSLSNLRLSSRHVEENPIYGNISYTQTSKWFGRLLLSICQWLNVMHFLSAGIESDAPHSRTQPRFNTDSRVLVSFDTTLNQCFSADLD